MCDWHFSSKFPSFEKVFKIISFFMTQDKFSEVVMNASSEIAWRILPRRPCGGQLLSSGSEFRKNNWGMILILHFRSCFAIILAASANDFNTLQVNFQRLHCIIRLVWPYYPANLSVYSKRYEWSYTNTMRRGQIVGWSMFCCSRWHSACSFVVTTFIWRAAAAVGSRPYK